MSTIMNWWLLTGTFILYQIYLIIYRLYFHPLSKFPGPKLAAATGWYETYFDLFVPPTGVFMYEIRRMHEIYGPIVRINPHEIHVSDSTWLDTIYTGPAHGTRDKYPPTAYLTGTPKGVFGTISHELHRKRRGSINSLFNKAYVYASTSMIYDKVDLLLGRIDKQISRDGCAEMRTNFLALATDTVAEYFLDESTHLLRDEERADNWHRAIRALANMTPTAKQFSWIIPLSLKLPVRALERLVPDTARIVRMHRDMEDQAKVAIREHYEEAQRGHEEPSPSKPSKQKLFRTILQNDELPPSEKVFDRMSHEGVTVIAAGGETTATSLAVATYFVLACRDKVQPRLDEELRGVMPEPNSRPLLRDLERLPWLTAVIKESLRISAVVTSRFPLISPKQPLKYKEWIIPPGTPVSMTLSEILMDPSVFEEPREFRPERWLPTNPDLEKINRCYVPFSRGNRMCMGVNLAYAELYIVIASLVRSGKFVLHDTIRERDIDFVRDCFIGDVSSSSKGIRIKYSGTQD